MSGSSQSSLESKERDADTVGLLSSEYRDDGDSEYSVQLPARAAAEKHRRRSRWIWTAVGVAVLCVTNVTTYAVTLELLTSGKRSCSAEVAVPPKGAAPFLRGLSTATTPKLLDATFYDSRDSIYRKHHSFETETAWKDLTRKYLSLLEPMG